MSSTTDPRYAAPLAAPKKAIALRWSDPRFRNIVWQVVILGAIALAGWYLVSNTTTNLKARRIATGFAFLGRTAGIPIGEHFLDYDPSVNDFAYALLLGALNTLKVAVVGVVLATLLGTVVGVLRLSQNWLINRICAIYVEVVRDIPLLLQLLFWYTMLQGLPAARQALNPVAGVFLSNRGMKLPALNWEPAHSWALLAFLLGAALTYAANRRATRVQDATGTRPAIWPVALGGMLALPLLVWAALGAPFSIDWPALRGFNFQGGITISPEYFALLLGLVVYTASYIAEIVRSGILAVPHGQIEAGGALGLRPGLVLRKIILPQAMRVIIPPMTSQYLNLTKNSSLAVAIGYQDLVSVADTTLNQTGQAIEGIFIIGVAYLAVSLSISAFMNWYNSRIALVER